MKKLLQLEEVALFGACLYYYSHFELSWWWFAAFILLPDVGMIGYIRGPRAGAWTYNLFHHRGLALVFFFGGVLMPSFELHFTGYILFAHATLDRMLGYGLKYESGFRFTHLGDLSAGKSSNA